MEERGAGDSGDVKAEEGAGQGSRGMWGRETGEAAVWEVASPRGRRPAHLGTSCSLGWWPRTCSQTGRLPQPNDSHPVPKPGIPGERIRRKGVPRPRPHACLSPRHSHRSPLSVFLQLLALLSPSPKLYTSAGPVPKSPGGEVGGPGSEREHAPLLLPRGPLPNLNLLLLWHLRGRRGTEENRFRMRKLNWESK